MINARMGAALALTVVSAISLSACSAAAPSDSGSDALEATDDGTALTMWTRAGTGEYATRLVDAYNASHENQVELTIIDDGQYQQKIATAAGGDNLPDLLSSDIIYMPNYTSKGIFAGLGDTVSELDYADAIAPSHLELSTWDDVLYGIPFKLDASALFYNKDLFEQAGLDPEQPPTTYQEFIDAAAAITALGDGISGVYIAGSCAGCEAYTVWPHVWASGGDVFTDQGATATFDSPEVQAALQMYADMWAAGSIDPASQAETGATWLDGFATGKIGMAPIGSFALGTYAGEVDFDFGVAGFPGEDGGTSSFIGGDSIGIGASSANKDQAWDFLEWSLSEEAQVGVVAANSDLPVRSDFADNEYSQADPRIVTLGELVAVGKTPFTLPYGALINDANGAWLPMFQDAVFNGNVEEATTSGNAEMQSVLDEQ